MVRAREIMIPTIGGLVGATAIAGFLYLTRGAWLPSLLRHPNCSSSRARSSTF